MQNENGIAIAENGCSRDGNRKQFIDVARGLAIICIILGHLGESGINRFVFTFHVPIFYLLSGFFINDRYSFMEFSRKKIRTLIVPYIVCCIFICILALVFNPVTYGNESNTELLFRWVYASLYGAGDAYQEPFYIPAIGAIWFLLATFWGSVFLRFLIDRKTVTRIIAVFLIFFISCWSRKICWLPFSIQAGGAALLFMYFGYLVKGILPYVKKMKREIQVVLTCVAFWVWIEFVFEFKSFWLVHCDYGRGVIDIIGSLCACCCVLVVSFGICLKKNCIADGLAYLGKYSLLVLSAHIIELDVFPWWEWANSLFRELSSLQFLWFRIIGKFIWIIPVTILLSKWKISRIIWGYEQIRPKVK